MRIAKRSFILACGVIGAVISAPAQALPVSVDLKGAAELMDSITKAVLQLPDLVSKSFSTVDSVKRKQGAFRARDRLLILSRRLSGLAIHQNGSTLNAADEYLNNPSPEGWLAFQQSISEVIKVAGGIESDLSKDETDFVLQKPYRDIMQSLQSRPFALRPLVHIPRPKSPKEMRYFRIFTIKYRTMVESLNVSIDRMNEYIRTLP